jgi:curved DNA-binding protein CbpA
MPGTVHSMSDIGGRRLLKLRRRSAVEAALGTVACGQPLQKRQRHDSPSDPTHYDTLGVLQRASMEEVRHAFKRSALRTHPDKGGSSEEFQRVLAAFEVLSCVVMRAEYDASLRQEGRWDAECLRPQGDEHDFASGTSRREGSTRGEARVLLEKVLLGDAHDLRNESPDMLVTLQELLKDAQRHGPAERDDQSTSATFKNISRAANSSQYRIKFSCFKMDIMAFTCSLNQAINYHIALSAWISKAKQAARLGTVGTQSCGRLDTFSNAISEADFFHTLMAEPSITVYFCHDHRTKSSRIVTSQTPDFRQALRFRKAIDDLMAQSNFDIEECKKNFRSLVQKNAKLRNQRRRLVSEAVDAELRSRERASQADDRSRRSRRRMIAAQVVPEHAAQIFLQDSRQS